MKSVKFPAYAIGPISRVSVDRHQRELRMKQVTASVGLISCLIGGCTSGFYSPPAQFAVQTFDNYKQKGRLRYDAVVNDRYPSDQLDKLEMYHEIAQGIFAPDGKLHYAKGVKRPDFVKREFGEVLLSICPVSAKPDAPSDLTCGAENEKPGASKASPGSSLDPTSYRCFAYKKPKSSACISSVLRHTIDQCVAKSGAQNTFVANVNIALGALDFSSAAISGIYLGKNGKDDAVAAALSTAAISNFGNAQKFLPSNVTSKAGDLSGAGQSYVALGDFKESDVACLHSLQSCDDSDGTPKVEVQRATFLRYARVHDVTFAVCPAGPY